MPDERQCFCACSFMNKVYLFGGHDWKSGYLKSCLDFDANKIRWKEAAKFNEEKSLAACSIFEESIVVSGGYNGQELNTVELYDAYSDSWTPMPNMIEERSHHSLVSLKSKLFAIGGANLNTNCEVFDKTSDMFVTLKTPKFYSRYVTAVLVKSKLFVFQSCKQLVLCYDVDKDKWSEESCEATENIIYFSSVKLPLY